MHGFRALLDDDAALGALLEGRWPEKPFVARGPVARLGSLADVDVPSLLAGPCRRRKAFCRTHDGPLIELPIGPGQERPLYESGHMLLLEGLEGAPFDAWLETLSAELALPTEAVRIHAIASREATRSLPSQSVEDVFLCQIRGRARWRAVARSEPATDDTFELAPGDVLFVPRHSSREVEATEQTGGLSLAIHVWRPTWRELLEFVLFEHPALHRTEFRSPLLDLFAGDHIREGFEDELTEKLRALVEPVLGGDGPRLPKKAFGAFLASRRR